MSTRARIIGVLLCALAHGVWLGASSHALVHNHAFCAHEHDSAARNDDLSEIEAATEGPADCPACQLALAAPEVPALTLPVTMGERSFAIAPSEIILLISVGEWSLPFGHAPPLA